MKSLKRFSQALVLQGALVVTILLIYIRYRKYKPKVYKSTCRRKISVALATLTINSETFSTVRFNVVFEKMFQANKLGNSLVLKVF